MRPVHYPANLIKAELILFRVTGSLIVPCRVLAPFAFKHLIAARSAVAAVVVGPPVAAQRTEVVFHYTAAYVEVVVMVHVPCQHHALKLVVKHVLQVLSAANESGLGGELQRAVHADVDAVAHVDGAVEQLLQPVHLVGHLVKRHTVALVAHVVHVAEHHIERIAQLEGVVHRTE